MTAAPTTTTAATADKPARTWQARRSDEMVVQVWRVIANSGPLGIGFTEIRTRLNDIDADVLKQHLHELRRKGHAVFNSPTGSTRLGCWLCTATPPPTEPPPMWMQHLGEDKNPADTYNAAQTKGDDVLAAARLLPNSAFALGGVQAPAPSQPEAEPEPAAAPAAPPAALPFIDGGAPSPLFSLQSDGALVGAMADGRLIYLNGAETRVLFQFLDRLVAVGHGSLSEAAS